MKDDKTPPRDGSRKNMSAFARMNDRAKGLNDVKINVVTVVIFIGCLAVLTFVATSIAYVTHRGVHNIERPGRS